jgi:hypothetical protein
MSIGYDLTRFQRDLVLDSLQEATACYWERRAEQLAEGLPRPTDRIVVGDQTERIARITEQMTACRNKAALLRMG